MRILLLEDHPGVVESLIPALEGRGHLVVHAGTVAEAEAAYDFDGFDAIVLDYELPDGTGLDFLATIDTSMEAAKTILYSGIDRSRELAASGLHVDAVADKADPSTLLDAIES